MYSAWGGIGHAWVGMGGGIGHASPSIYITWSFLPMMAGVLPTTACVRVYVRVRVRFLFCSFGFSFTQYIHAASFSMCVCVCG